MRIPSLVIIALVDFPAHQIRDARVDVRGSISVLRPKDQELMTALVEIEHLAASAAGIAHDRMLGPFCLSMGPAGPVLLDTHTERRQIRARAHVGRGRGRPGISPTQHTAEWWGRMLRLEQDYVHHAAP